MTVCLHPRMYIRAACYFGARFGSVGAMRGLGMVVTAWACRAGLAPHQHSIFLGAASRRLLSGGGGRRGGGTGARVGSDFHKTKKLINNKQIAIHLNRQILSSDTETLCGIIKARAEDFNHVNVATALRKALEAPRHRVPRDIMGILELKPQEVANTVWAYATIGRKPVMPG